MPDRSEFRCPHFQSSKPLCSKPVSSSPVLNPPAVFPAVPAFIHLRSALYAEAEIESDCPYEVPRTACLDATIKEASLKSGPLPGTIRTEVCEEGKKEEERKKKSEGQKGEEIRLNRPYRLTRPVEPFDFCWWNEKKECVELRSAAKWKTYTCRSMKVWLEALCLLQGTSLSACRKSWALFHGTMRNAPLILREFFLVRIPDGPDGQEIWIDWSQVRSCEYKKTSTKVIFADGLMLELNNPNAVKQRALQHCTLQMEQSARQISRLHQSSQSSQYASFMERS